MFFPPGRNCRPLKMHHADSCPFRHKLHLCSSEQGEEALCREEAELPAAGRLCWWEQTQETPLLPPPPKLNGDFSD